MEPISEVQNKGAGAQSEHRSPMGERLTLILGFQSAVCKDFKTGLKLVTTATATLVVTAAVLTMTTTTRLPPLLLILL